MHFYCLFFFFVVVVFNHKHIYHYLKNVHNYAEKRHLHRGSYMIAHVLLILLNELRKSDKMRGLLSILSLFATSLINSITQEHEY